MFVILIVVARAIILITTNYKPVSNSFNAIDMIRIRDRSEGE
jgi:hypothetical protein